MSKGDPTQVNLVRATLFTISKEGSIVSYNPVVSNEDFTITKTTTTVTITKESIPVGNYYLEVKFYKDAIVLGQWFETVDIAGGLTSTGSVKLEYLEPLYSVKYNLCNDGNTIKFHNFINNEYKGYENLSASSITKDIVARAERLPYPEWEGHVFLGWYLDQTYTLPAVVNKKTPLDLADETSTELWAKWIEGSLNSLGLDDAVAVIQSIDPSEASMFSPATIKITGALDSNELTTVAAALRKNIQAYINLDLTDVTGLTNVPNYCFSDCTNLVGITLPETMTTLFESPFFNTGISTFIIPKNVETIVDNPFTGCSQLESISVQEGNTHFFVDNKCLYDTDKKLYSYPAKGGISKVVLRNDTVVIRSKAFYGAKYLVVELNDGLTEIESSAFANSGVSYLTIPDTVQKIGREVFYGCESLNTVTIGSGTTNIDRSFAINSSLENISVDTANTVYKDNDGILYSKDGKELLCYPAGRRADNGIFVIPNYVETIKGYAFYNPLYLKNVTLGSKVNLIEYYAFYKFGYVTVTDDYLWDYCPNAEFGLTYDEVGQNKIGTVPLSEYLCLNCEPNSYFAKSDQSLSGYIETFDLEFEDTISPATGVCVDVSDSSYTIYNSNANKFYKLTGTVSGCKYKVNWVDSYSINQKKDYINYPVNDLIDNFIRIFDLYNYNINSEFSQNLFLRNT